MKFSEKSVSQCRYLWLILPAFFLLHSEGRSDDTPRTITVTATGDVTAKADRLSLKVRLLTSGETQKEAKAKFDKLRGQFTTRINVMKFRSLKIKSTARSIGSSSQNGQFGDGDPFGALIPAEMKDASEGEMSVAESFDLTLDGIDKISSEEVDATATKLIEELNAIELAPSSGMSTTLIDRSSAVVKSYAVAMEKARAKATALATLAGGKIGKVISIEEAGIESTVADFYSSINNLYGQGQSAGLQNEISISAKLNVVFELIDP